MTEMEKGIYLTKIKRSDLDANPPKELKDKIEKSLAKVKCRTRDMIPEAFSGKGGKGYLLKEMVVHRGPGSPKVSKSFRDSVRMTGTDIEYRMNKFMRLRMKLGGPRYAAMSNRFRD
jgi:hypothetical protein